MMLRKHKDGSAEFRAETPPDAPADALVFDPPAHLREALRRAYAAGRLDVAAGELLLDGQRWRPPAAESGLSYTEAASRIEAAPIPAGLKSLLKLLLELALEHGKVEL